MGKKNKVDANVKNLPIDIEENILLRLPVKTLLRFRYVCKSWYSLILDPRFINIHTQRNRSNNSNLLVTRLHRIKKNRLVVMDSSSSKVYARNNSLVDLDTSHEYFERRIVGSYDGVVCIHGICRSCCQGGKVHENFYLWNPSLGITKTIMNHIHPFNTNEDDLYQTFVGFGFHNGSNDYKVLRFKISGCTVRTKVEIYSLSCNSWKTVKVDDLPGPFSNCYEGRINLTAHVGVYVNGAHHWLVSSGIISFDMGEEVFKEMIIPSEEDMLWENSTLFNYKNESSLAMFNFPYIWVMKDYGVPESWTKLHMIDVHVPLEEIAFVGSIQIKQINALIILSRARERLRRLQNNIVRDTDACSLVEGTSSSRRSSSRSIASIKKLLEDAVEVKNYRESLMLLDSLNSRSYITPVYQEDYESE